MEETTPWTDQVYAAYNFYGTYAGYIISGIGVLILLVHLFKLGVTKDFKSRYDYISRYEINLLWTIAIFLIVGLGILVNTFIPQEENIVWLFVRLFVTIMMGIIVGVIVQNILKFYYPFFIEKRLKKLRYTPRISPKTGKPMKLLSEEEEDVYLDEGMIAEEDVFSVDYDVWLDEETNYTKIERYAGHLTALKCPECSYQTLKIVKEEVVESPTEDHEGELIKFYKCSYCGYKTRKSFHAKLRHDV